jgi:hypothetical protein
MKANRFETPAFSPQTPDASLRELLRILLRHPTKKRETIAEEVTGLVKEPISLAMLDNWAAASKHGRHRLPAAFVPALCEVLGNDDLKRWMNCPKFTERRELRQRIIELQRRLTVFLSHEKRLENKKRN